MTTVYCCCCCCLWSQQFRSSLNWITNNVLASVATVSDIQTRDRFSNPQLKQSRKRGWFSLWWWWRSDAISRRMKRARRRRRRHRIRQLCAGPPRVRCGPVSLTGPQWGRPPARGSAASGAMKAAEIADNCAAGRVR